MDSSPASDIPRPKSLLIYPNAFPPSLPQIMLKASQLSDIADADTVSDDLCLAIALAVKEFHKTHDSIYVPSALTCHLVGEIDRA